MPTAVHNVYQLDEEKIRKYVQWQEKQAKMVQGKLFDYASILNARAFQAQNAKAAAFGGGSLLELCYG